MLTLSYTASEYLDLLLGETNAPDDDAIRLVLEGDGFKLEYDTARPGDTTFDHEGIVVLVIDEQVSGILADMKLDVKVTGEESKLVLIDLLQE